MKKIIGVILIILGFVMFFSSCSTVINNADIGGGIAQLGIAILLAFIGLLLFIIRKVYGDNNPIIKTEVISKEKPFSSLSTPPVQKPTDQQPQKESLTYIEQVSGSIVSSNPIPYEDRHAEICDLDVEELKDIGFLYKVYRLTGNRNKTMQEYIEDISSGDELRCEQNYDNKYEVYNYVSDCVGFLPLKAADDFKDLEDTYIVVDEIEITDDLKSVVKVAVFRTPDYQYVKDVAGTQYYDINFETLSVGGAVHFIQESENEYDSRAIAIYFDNNKIGHVCKGQIQDMINDWIGRGDKLVAYISNFDKEEKRVSYYIAFYKK